MQLSDVPEIYQGDQVEERRRRMNDKLKIAGLDASIVAELKVKNDATVMDVAINRVVPTPIRRTAGRNILPKANNLAG